MQPQDEKKCIYCGNVTLTSDFTLEHAIPRFLGGAHAPDRFKVSLVCSRCNKNLGLFVDGAFARTWWVSNWLASAARASYDPKNPFGIPLVCMGSLEIKPPGILDDELCELWLGPHGELVYWVRPKDERLYWYVGGNPITAKQRETRAYFFFGENSHRDPTMSWLAFRDAFSDSRVRKLMCTDVAGADPASIGFVQFNSLDEERRAYFQGIADTREAKASMSVHVKYDFRFMSKLGLGIG